MTDVPSGKYIIRQTVNPDRLTSESDYENNVAECTINLWTGDRKYVQLEKNSCRLSGKCCNNFSFL